MKANDWAAEGRDALGQIAKDIAAAYEERFAAGKAELCPSGLPVPKNLQAAGTQYKTTCEEAWTDGAGWDCLRFCMNAPMWFQYELVSDGHARIGRPSRERVAGGRGGVRAE